MMQAYDITTYGERMAEVYDQWPGVPQNTDAIVAGLLRLAGSGPIDVRAGSAPQAQPANS
jgi:hypothetical protein